MATKRKYIKRRSSRKIRGGIFFGHSMRVAKAQREKNKKTTQQQNADVKKL